jgi:glycine/D-amino acid oxidase-like deaminating enzyme
MATLQAALPREHYVNQAQYEREREIVLARSWTCAGRLADLGLVDGARGLLPNRLSMVALLAESVLGFKFAPTFGRILADLATTGTTSSDVGAFAIDRPALTAPAGEPSWLV